MSAPPTRQRALYMRDTWVRGANYVRRLTVIGPDGQPLDLSGWPTLRFGLEGERGTSSPSPFIDARYDDSRGGAAAGAVTVTLFEDGLELDRRGSSGSVIYTIAARRFAIDDRPLVHCRLRVRESALR